MRGRISALACVVLALPAVGGCGGSAAAPVAVRSAPLISIFETGQLFSDPVGTLHVLRRLGVDVVRVDVAADELRALLRPESADAREHPDRAGRGVVGAAGDRAGFGIVAAATVVHSRHHPTGGAPTPPSHSASSAPDTVPTSAASQIKTATSTVDSATTAAYAGLASLAACCVVFGVLPRFFLDSVMAPAAASLLNPDRYDSGVLTGLARLPVLHLPFDYASSGALTHSAPALDVGLDIEM